MNRLLRSAKKAALDLLSGSLDALSLKVESNKTTITNLGDTVNNLGDRITNVENTYVSTGSDKIELAGGKGIEATEEGISFTVDGTTIATLDKDGGWKDGGMGYASSLHSDLPSRDVNGTLTRPTSSDCFYVGTSSELHNISAGKYDGHMIILRCYDEHTGFNIYRDGNIKAFKAASVNIRGRNSSVTLMWSDGSWICTSFNNWDDFGK